MSEKKRETRVFRRARKEGWWCRKFTSPGYRGVADRLFLRDGRHVFIELKDDGEEPTPLQYERLKEVRDHGGEADWANTDERVWEILSGDYESSLIPE